MPLVSIIVPIYNAAHHLPNCIDSITNQTYRNLQIILIDDGSTDDSAAICDMFAKKDCRILVHQQANAGASQARNTGIKYADGVFIQFIDADDYIEPDMTEDLVEAIESSCDLVVCGYRQISIQGKRFITKRYLPKISGIYDKGEFFQHIGSLYKNILLPSPCNKLYRNELIQKHQLRFQQHVNMGEDLLFNLDYLHHCQRVHIIEKSLYNYSAVTNHSLSRSYKTDFFANQQMLFNQMRYFLRAHQSYNRENKLLLHMVHANSVINAINNLFHPESQLSPAQKKAAISTMMENEEVKQTLHYFNDSMQTKIVGTLLKHELPLGVYSFFKTKHLVKRQMYPLFTALKKIHER